METCWRCPQRMDDLNGKMGEWQPFAKGCHSPKQISRIEANAPHWLGPIADSSS